MGATSTDSTHRVTINAATDMLTEEELHSAIHSLSSSATAGTAAAPPLSLSLPQASSSGLGRVTSVSMVIEPELVETGALPNSPSPSSSHGHLDDAVSAPTGELVVGGSDQIRPANSLQGLVTHTPTAQLQVLGRSSGQPLSLSGGVATAKPFHLAGSRRDDRLVRERGREGITTATELREFEQLEQLDSQISNILVQSAAGGGAGPDQYIIQTTPILELVSSSAAHTVTINPSSGIISDGNQGGLPRRVTGSRVSQAFTPINATHGPPRQQDSTFLSQLRTSSGDPPMET